jgi:hypothetical protein
MWLVVIFFLLLTLVDFAVWRLGEEFARMRLIDGDRPRDLYRMTLLGADGRLYILYMRSLLMAGEETGTYRRRSFLPLLCKRFCKIKHFFFTFRNLTWSLVY